MLVQQTPSLSGKPKMTLEAFMISLANGLVNKSTTVVNQETGAAVFPIDDCVRLKDHHFLESIGLGFQNWLLRLLKKTRGSWRFPTKGEGILIF